jgi:hypothetical protein
MQVPEASVEAVKLIVPYAVFEVGIVDLARTLCQNGGKFRLLDKNTVSIVGSDICEDLEARKDIFQMIFPAGTDHKAVCFLAVLYRRNETVIE